MKVITYFCLAALLVSCGGAKGEKGNEPLTVKVFQVESLSDESRREFSFISQPYKTTDLSFRVGGPVTHFDTRSGQLYRKGETIASIDSRDFVIRKEKAEAIWSQAKAEYTRIAALYEKNNISGSSYEKAQSDLAIAKAAFETAKNELTDTRLIAPFDGYVQAVYIERYQDVRASQSIVTFIDLSKIKIEAYIPENVAIVLRNRLHEASCSLKIGFDALPDKEYAATEVEISKSTTPNNLSFLLTAILDNPKNDLLGGMSGGVSFDLPAEAKQEAVFIPQSAICNRPETGTFVWRLTDGNQVKRIPVRVGNLKKGNKIEVVSGLTPKDKVVLTGHSFLSDNEVVNVENEQVL